MSKLLKNKHGEIAVGTKVRFSMENQNQWIGPNIGTLDHDGSGFIIRTKEGIVTINEGYDAYLNTVEPIGTNAELSGCA